MNYFNTTELANEQVTMFETKNRNQNETVLEVAKKIKGEFSGEIIYDNYPCAKTPLTSIRRAITKLKDTGMIEHAKDQLNVKKRRMSRLGRPEFLYTVV